MRKNWKDAPLFRWASQQDRVDCADPEGAAIWVDLLVDDLSRMPTEEAAKCSHISDSTICAFRSWIGAPRGYSPATRAAAMKEVKACWQAKREEWKRLYREYRQTMADLGAKRKVAR